MQTVEAWEWSYSLIYHSSLLLLHVLCDILYTHFYTDKKLEELKKNKELDPGKLWQIRVVMMMIEVGQKAVSLDTTADYKKQNLSLLQEGTFCFTCSVHML